MHWLKQFKIKKGELVLPLIFVFGIIFLFSDAPSASARTFMDCAPFNGNFFNCLASNGEVGSVGFLEPISNVFLGAIKWVMYGVIMAMQLLASAALVLFEYVIDPAHMVQLMNLSAVTDLWRFVRDFFNLFFILVLLFSAFATIFQVEQYSLKKLFLSILLGALLVNFSFPITRFLIDTTNVPMYFFVNALSPNGAANGAKDSTFGSILKASDLTKLILAASPEDSEVSSLVLACLFMFIFTISLVVLSVMMFVRVIGLVILLIFSPIGFIASAIPGLQKYGSEWWEKFWKYALFGPAAMLILFVAVRFMVAVQASQFMQQVLSSTGQNITTSPGSTSYVVSMALFSLPIILIWMAIGTANSFSIAGAGMVTGWGQKVAKWGGSQALRGGKWVGYKNPIARGLGGGVKDRFDNNKFVKFFRSPSKTEAAIKGALGTGTVRGELDTIHHKAAYEEAEKMKKSNVSNTALSNSLKGKDKVKATAAAMILSERKAIDTADEFSLALAALGSNTKEVASLINAASSDALKIDTTTTAGADKYEKMVTSGAFDVNKKLREQLENKIKKEGHAKVLIDQEINKTPAAGVAPLSRQAAYDKYLSQMTAEDIAKMKGVHGGAGGVAPQPEIITFVTNQTTSTPGAPPIWDVKEHQDAYKKLSTEQKAAWRAAGIAP